VNDEQSIGRRLILRDRNMAFYRQSSVAADRWPVQPCGTTTPEPSPRGAKRNRGLAPASLADRPPDCGFSLPRSQGLPLPRSQPALSP